MANDITNPACGSVRLSASHPALWRATGMAPATRHDGSVALGLVQAVRVEQEVEQPPVRRYHSEFLPHSAEIPKTIIASRLASRSLALRHLSIRPPRQGERSARRILPVREIEDRILLRMRPERGYTRGVHGDARRVPEVVQSRQDKERPGLQGPHAIPEGFGPSSIGWFGPGFPPHPHSSSKEAHRTRITGERRLHMRKARLQAPTSREHHAIAP